MDKEKNDSINRAVIELFYLETCRAKPAINCFTAGKQLTEMKVQVARN